MSKLFLAVIPWLRNLIICNKSFFWNRLDLTKPLNIIELNIDSFITQAIPALISKFFKTKMYLKLLTYGVWNHPPVAWIAWSVRPVDKLFSGDARILHIVKVEEYVFASLVTDKEPVILVVLEKLQVACVSFGVFRILECQLVTSGIFRREIIVIFFYEILLARMSNTTLIALRDRLMVCLLKTTGNFGVESEIRMRRNHGSWKEFRLWLEILLTKISWVPSNFWVVKVKVVAAAHTK